MADFIPHITHHLKFTAECFVNGVSNLADGCARRASDAVRDLSGRNNSRGGSLLTSPEDFDLFMHRLMDSSMRPGFAARVYRRADLEHDLQQASTRMTLAYEILDKLIDNGLLPDADNPRARALVEESLESFRLIPVPTNTSDDNNGGDIAQT